jgi:hypothetical protein
MNVAIASVDSGSTALFRFNFFSSASGGGVGSGVGVTGRTTEVVGSSPGPTIASMSISAISFGFLRTARSTTADEA